MSDEYDNTNTAAFFLKETVAKMEGPVDIEGESSPAIVVQRKSKNNKTYFDVYRKVGALFPQDDSDNKPRLTGPIHWFGKIYRMALWKKESRNGDTFYQGKITEDSGEGIKPEPKANKKDDLEDDEIPF